MKPREDQFEDGSRQSGIRLLIISLFIILLAFFVVINSIAVIDERRKFEALGSLTGTFGVLPGGLSPLQGELKEISPPQPPVLSDESTISETETRSEPLSLRTSQEEKVVSIQDYMIFDEGRLTIRRSSYDFLKRLCDVINQDSYSVEIVGHTDNRPPDQDLLHSNWELSALKAQEVLKFFVSIGKVDPARLTAYGCGEYKPIASNEAKETRAQNRRVDIVLDRKSEGGLAQIYRKEQSRFFVFKRFLFRMVD